MGKHFWYAFVSTLLWLAVMSIAGVAHGHELNAEECRAYAQTGLSLAEKRIDGVPKWAAFQEMQKELDEHPDGTLVQDDQDGDRLTTLLTVVYSHLKGQPDNLPGEVYDAQWRQCTKGLNLTPLWKNEMPPGIVPSGPHIES